jgi:SAM-dependent MidA family methyltransferase
MCADKAGTLQDQRRHLDFKKIRFYGERSEWGANLFKFCSQYSFIFDIPVAELSNARVCGRLFAEIAGSNTAEGMDVCYL